MLLIYKGSGPLAIITIAAPIICTALALEQYGGTEFVEQNIPLLYIGLLGSIVLTWKVGKWFNSQPGRELLDLQTQQVFLKNQLIRCFSFHLRNGR